MDRLNNNFCKVKHRKEFKTRAQIADECGISVDTLMRKLKAAKIELPKGNLNQSSQEKILSILNTELKTRNQIAMEYGISTDTLRRKLKLADVKLPSGDLSPSSQAIIEKVLESSNYRRK